MKKILIIFGTRPEAIKLCPIALELEKHTDSFESVVCVTAQHREMLDQVLNIFDIKPDYDLNLMEENQSLFDLTANVLLKTGEVIEREKPDIVLVQGDTTTTFCASLAAYYRKVKVGHVEAGLRTKNKYSPFPEEINRKLTGAIADIHFAPTERNKRNLLSEGIPEENIVITGNTVIDALFWVRQKIRSENKRYDELGKIDFSKRVILVTGHRRENFGKALLNLCKALREVAERNKELELVYPVHLNPNVKEPVYNLLSGIENIKLLGPVGYEAFVYLMDRCYFVISDSGGIQEEAPSLGKPVLVTRNVTERPEVLELGAVKLVGAHREKIVMEAEQLLNDREHYARMSEVQNPYGDGHACRRIIEGLVNLLGSSL